MPKRRYKKLTDKQIINLFERKHPKNLKEIKALGLRPRFFDEGCDRMCYRIGKDMVLKIEDADKSSYDQTPTEIRNLRKIHKLAKYKHIRKHIVKLLYADSRNRIQLVPYYPGSIKDERYYDGFPAQYEKTIDFIIGELSNIDLHNGNFRIARDGTVVCVDLGL